MKNTITLINARIYTEASLINNGYLKIVDEKIVEIGKMEDYQFENNGELDLGGKLVLPGFIDLQVNGAGGYLATDKDGEDIPKVQQALAKNGTTSFLVATSPCEDSQHLALLKNCSKFMPFKEGCANLLGVHMEGPFMNPKKAGANNPNFTSNLDLNKFREFSSFGTLKMMTLSPEIGDISEIASFANDNGIVISIGHSEANYDEASEAFKKGAKCATHLFNTMNGIIARNPGIIGAALDNDVFYTIISDGVHVHPFNLKMLYKMGNANRAIIITDSAPTAGTSKKEWDFDGMKIIVKGYTCYTEDGHIMGSSLTMVKGAKTFKRITNCSLEEVVKMCSENPAKLLNCFDKKGSIAVGKDADLIVLNNEEEFDVLRVFVMGKEVC